MDLSPQVHPRKGLVAGTSAAAGARRSENSKTDGLQDAELLVCPDCWPPGPDDCRRRRRDLLGERSRSARLEPSDRPVYYRAGGRCTAPGAAEASQLARGAVVGDCPLPRPGRACHWRARAGAREKARAISRRGRRRRRARRRMHGYLRSRAAGCRRRGAGKKGPAQLSRQGARPGGDARVSFVGAAAAGARRVEVK